MKFTQKAVDSFVLPAGKSEAIVFNDELAGFGIRIRRGGARTWIFQYKIGTQHRRITLGSATALSLAQARKTATDLHAQVRLGRDPSGEKTEGRIRAAETVAAALASYLPYQRSHLKPRSYTEVERHLLKHCKPLHGLQLDKVDRRTVAARMTAIATKSGDVTANRVRASLAAFFAWAIREGLAEFNPVAGTGRREERSRERVLTDPELKAIWAATAGGDDYSAVVRLLALTGARASEIGALRRSEIEGDRIFLPGSRTKNGRPHVIPLAPAALELLEGRPSRADRDFVFGRQPDRPLTGWSVCKVALDARIGDAVKGWTHHDLRRTLATRLGELGVAPHIIEALLNHVSGHKHGVAAVYNRANYEIQKRQALTLWAEHLLAIVEGRKATVVSMLRA
jgi:integrase